MPVNFTVKNIPSELYEKLKESATLHRRSINSEVIYCLEQMLTTHRIDTDAFLARVEALRKRVSAPPLTDEMLRKAKEEGRP